jgi:hypothetical protein
MEPPPSTALSRRLRVVLGGALASSDEEVVVSLGSWLDDTEWEPWKRRVLAGEFRAACLQLPSETFGGELRSEERPCGIRELKGPVREAVRRDNVLSRRVASVARILEDSATPWVAWSQRDDVVNPLGQPEWASLRESLRSTK